MSRFSYLVGRFSGVHLWPVLGVPRGFTLKKEKDARRVGDLRIRLKGTDPRRSRYTIEVLVDDKTVEKRDKTVNEPVQFILSRSTQVYELVVFDIKKDVISGYVSAPKGRAGRSQ